MSAHLLESILRVLLQHRREMRAETRALIIATEQALREIAKGAA